MSEIELVIKPRRVFKAYLQRSKRWACMVVHRRGGKTYASIQDICAKALMHKRQGPPLRYAYIAPTRDQAKDVAWAYIKTFLSPIPGTEINESELRVTLYNGATIRLYSGDTYDRMRGLYFDGVIIDEPADIDPQAWPLVIRPCLTDYQGWATFIGTPKGKDAFHDIYKEAISDPEWYTLFLPASQSGIIDDDELRKIRRTIKEDAFLQEYECDFTVARKGAIYARFLDAAINEGRITDNVEYWEGFPVYTAFDIGAPINQKCWIFQIVGDRINYLECATGGEDRSMPGDWAMWLKAKSYRYGGHFLPHDGEILWQRAMREAELDNVVIVPKQRNVWDGINDAITNITRCRFHKTACADGIDALEKYHSKEERDGATIKDVPVHDWASHYSDAFSLSHQAMRHGLCVDRSAIPTRARTQPRPQLAQPAHLPYAQPQSNFGGYRRLPTRALS